MRRRTFLGTTLAAVAVAFSTASLSLRAAAAQMVSALSPRRRRLILPPVPKWNPQTDDIDSRDYFQRCQDFERSLLPRDLVFPRTGQVWEAVRDCRIYAVNWTMGPKAPVGWPETQLRQGDRVRVLTLDNPKPLRVMFQPVRDQPLSASLAPDTQDCPFWLWTAPGAIPAWGETTGYFTEMFRLVEDAA